MKGIREIFRKEIARVVKDKKMLFSVFLLPALLMVGLMMLIGNLQKNMMADIDNHIPGYLCGAISGKFSEVFGDRRIYI